MQRILIIFLLCNTISSFASVVDTVWVVSKKMNKKVPNLVILPDSYHSSSKYYPTVYILHGAGDNYSSWLSQVATLKNYADDYQMILICPDGGSTSWYFDSLMDKSSQYESYITNDLVNYIDQKFRTNTDKSQRAITGASMGGHGALYLSLKHPQLWGAAGSISGGLDIRSFPNNWDLPKHLGNYEDHKENWEFHTVINLLKNWDRELKIIFDCGTEDFFFEVNKECHKKLNELNIPHVFEQRSGGHDWSYRKLSIKKQIDYFHQFFTNKL